MGDNEHIHKLAELNQKPDSVALHRILEDAVTDEEARFLLELPAPTAELAKRYGMGEASIEEKIKGFARRGLVVHSDKGIHYPRDLATLHDNMLASARQYVSADSVDLWMDLYEGEGWANEIGQMLASFPSQALRAIPILGSVSADEKLLRHESIAGIIEAKQDLITIRHCCCRTGANKCEHPKEVCMQFGGRAEYDLYRESGRKVSADEAMAIAKKAGDSGLVPMVPNVSSMEAIEFICFCCGCCCLVLDPASRIGATEKILAPSRFLCEVEEDKCTGCDKCLKPCFFDAIEMQEVLGEETTKAVIDAEKCVGCGDCVPSCPELGCMTMKAVRPPEFIPDTFGGPEAVLHME
jgi:Na+-translocating ferredoxin:NAD+ oxidoreductase RNF subunit RnfB